MIVDKGENEHPQLKYVEDKKGLIRKHVSLKFAFDFVSPIKSYHIVFKKKL